MRRFAPARTRASLVVLVLLVSASWAAISRSDVDRPAVAEPAELAAFRASADDHVVPVTIELRSPPAARHDRAGATWRDALGRLARNRLAQQDAFIASLPAHGIRLLPARAQARQADGATRAVTYRYTTLLNGFSAWVAEGDVERLRKLPDVRSVHLDHGLRLQLNRAIDYTLATNHEPAARRLAVYGADEEMAPAGSAGHPETPKTTTADGYEGQGIVVSVIDTGIDWKHPMFGGTGHTTPTPQLPPNAPASGDNTKVKYLVNLSAGDPGDDFGHGTFVASNAGGYRVDGDTPANPGYGIGQDGSGVGPTPGGTVLHGTAPQVELMGYKTLSAAGTGVNNSTQLALDDSVSPCVTAVDTTGQCIEKPIADVINLSLGGGGSAISASSKIANNAALSGAIVVASAGNDGPGATTVGAPCMGTLVICVAASLDPGSISGAAVLAPGSILAETGLGAGPAPETGAASDANAPQPGERQTIRLFNAAGGGPIPDGSLSAHYVYADMAVLTNTAPTTVANRIALVNGTGAFANIANSVAPLGPAAILIITDVESATAVAVIGGVPTFTINPADADYLLGLMDAGDEVPHGTVSTLPLRITDGIALDVYEPAMAGFSSRGPNAVAGSDYRNIKPDVTAPGAGILAAATPDGNPNASGMGEPSGYIVASGTSFSGPITAGAMALIRQHVRETLGLDTIDLDDPQYRAKRFDTVTVARALAQNTATNLRSGRGVAEPDGTDSATVHDLGSGHINVAAALDAKAILVAPTKLLGNGVEFDVPALNPPTLDANGHLDVLLPTYSFGPVGVAGAPGVIAKTVPAFLRDVTDGDGAGSYTLTWQNDLNASHPGVAISFLPASGTTPITSINVSSGGTAEFKVRIAIDGQQYLLPNTDILWYVTATHSSGRKLRMPLYLRAVAYESSLVTAAPVQAAPTVETSATAPECGTDFNGFYTLNFTYTLPSGGATPIGFRVQEGTTATALFEDAADEQLVAGANSKWTGSPQWTSSVNPDTGNPAYYIPDAAEQNEVLTMIDAVTLPEGASLSFDSFQSTEADFDYAVVELIVDGALVELGVFSGDFAGTRTFDLTPYGGSDVKVQFRLTSDQNSSAPGWWIENIRIQGDDFATLDEIGADETSYEMPARTNGTRFYRIAALFDDPVGTLAGPYSNVECVTVEIPNLPPVADAGADFDVDEGQTAMLSGAGSTDSESDALTYAWTQTDGPMVTLSNANTATATFTAPSVSLATPLTFELEVTDTAGNSDTDSIVVTVLDTGGGTTPDPDTRMGNTAVGGGLPPVTLSVLGLLALWRGARRSRWARV
jgi:subtilisin family serine protease